MKNKYFFLISLRIRKSEQSNVLKLNSVTKKITNVGNKSSFSKYRDSDLVEIKLSSNKKNPNISFLRTMFEDCFGVNVDYFSIFIVSYDEYLEQIKGCNITECLDENLDCIAKIEDYKNNLKIINRKNFDHATRIVIADEIINSIMVKSIFLDNHLNDSDYLYFKYHEDSVEAILTEISLDNIE